MMKTRLTYSLMPAFFVTVPQIVGCLRRNVQKLCVLCAAFHAVVCPGEGLGKVFADLLVELFVLFIADFFFGASPQSGGFVDGFPFASLDHAARLAAFTLVFANQLTIFPFFFFHQDGQADVV